MSTFAAARLRALPDGEPTAVLPGGLIGRLSSAALRLSDSGVSEAHAMVSLRGGALWLLGLRGALSLRRAGGASLPEEWRRVAELELAPGQRVRLGERAIIEVLEVALPTAELTLCLPGGEVVPLSPELALAASLLGPPFEVTPGFVPGAVLRLFNPGDGWCAEHADGRQEELIPHSRLDVAGASVVIGERPFGGGGAPTRSAAPSRSCTVDWEGTVLRERGGARLTLRGKANELVCELSLERQAWSDSDTVATAIWPDEADPKKLNQRWHKTLWTLRQALVSAGLPDDLVLTDYRHGYRLNRQGWMISP